MSQKETDRHTNHNTNHNKKSQHNKTHNQVFLLSKQCARGFRRVLCLFSTCSAQLLAFELNCARLCSIVFDCVLLYSVGVRQIAE